MLKRIAHRIIPRLALGLCLLALASCLWPGSAALAQNPPLDEPRYCTWLFWSKDPALIKLALERLAQGDPFMIVARETAREHSKNSQANADCMKASGMDQAVLAVVKDLKIGEISRPFDLGGGTALVMRTTDQHRRKAQALYSKGRYSQAERELLRDLRLHPASAAAWHMLALTRTAQGNYKQALAALDKALVWSPRNSAMLNDKASALANLGRSKQAVKVFEKALKLDPKNPTIMSNLAWALTLIRKDPKRAEALAKQACNEAPQEARFWHTMGKVQAAQGEHGKAVVSFRQTLMLEPKNKTASLDLVKSIKALGPKVLARLSGKTPPPEPITALKPVPKPEPQKVEQGIGKGLKRAPDLAGPAIALPSQWPALPKPKAKTAVKPEVEAKTAANQKSAPETQAKPEPKAAPPAEPSAGPKGRIVSLPMPKFPEPPSAAPVQAKDDDTAQKDKAAPKPAPADIEKEAAKPADKPKSAEAKPAPPEIKPEKADKEPTKPKAEAEPEKAKALAKDEPAEPEAPSQKIAVKPKPGKDVAKRPEAQPAKPKAPPKPDKPKAAEPKAKPANDEAKTVVKAETKATQEKPTSEAKSQGPVKEKAGEPKPKPGMAADQKAAVEPAKPKPAPKTAKPKTAEAKPTPVKADAKTAPEPSPKPSIETPHYLIQVASYRPESLARKELRAWQRRKMSGHIEKWQDKRGRTWHRVLLGPFAAAKDAETKARALKAKRLVRDYYVVKRPAD